MSIRRRCRSQACRSGQMPCCCETLTQGPALTRVVNGQVEHARMDLVFDQNGTTTNLDVAIVSPFSSSPATSSQQPAPTWATWPREQRRSKFGRYPHVNLVPFVLETTGRPGYHVQKFISNFMKVADNPPPGPPSRASSTAPSPNNN